jgi:hypothetical protein
MTKSEAIKLACRDCDYKWPKELFTGVMFYNGYRITIEEFTELARMFKGYGNICNEVSAGPDQVMNHMTEMNLPDSRQAMDEHMVKTSSAKKL